jgi:glycosyltransferase involved in cell wall biosynthesis
MYNYARVLTQRGHEVDVVTPDQRIRWQPDWSSPPAEARNRIAGVGAGQRIRRIDERLFAGALQGRLEALRDHFFGLPAMAYAARFTRSLLRNCAPSDVTIATGWNTAFAAAFRSEESLAFYYLQHYEELFFRRAEKMERLLCRMTYGLPLHLIANSPWLENQIRSRFGRTAKVIEHALMQPEIFNTNGLDLPAKFAAPGPVRIVCYSDPRPFKGWSVAVEAMKRVLAQLDGRQVEWVTYGTRQPTPGVPQTALGRISNDRLVALYGESHIGFVPSLYESFPLPPLEMMATGCALVTTPLGCESYARDGENCLLARAGDPEDLAAKIVQLARDPSLALRLAQTAPATVARYSWDRSADRLLAVIEEADRGPRLFADVESLLPA